MPQCSRQWRACGTVGSAAIVRADCCVLLGHVARAGCMWLVNSCHAVQSNRMLDSCVAVQHNAGCKCKWCMRAYGTCACAVRVITGAALWGKVKADVDAAWQMQHQRTCSGEFLFSLWDPWQGVLVGIARGAGEARRTFLLLVAVCTFTLRCKFMQQCGLGLQRSGGM